MAACTPSAGVVQVGFSTGTGVPVAPDAPGSLTGTGMPIVSDVPGVLSGTGVPDVPDEPGSVSVHDTASNPAHAQLQRIAMLIALFLDRLTSGPPRPGKHAIPLADCQVFMD